MKWHYDYEDILEFSHGVFRNGKYLAYDSEVFEKLLNDRQWVKDNDAYDEASYIWDYCDESQMTNDGKIIFVPCPEVAMSIETHYACLEESYDEGL